MAGQVAEHEGANLREAGRVGRTTAEQRGMKPLPQCMERAAMLPGLILEHS